MASMNMTKYEEIGYRLRQLPPEKHMTSYEWEELVQRLCSSDDTGLHDIGIRERDELRQQRSVSGGTETGKI